jgi:type II secretory pathway predicted ATPase ExeA
MYEKRFGLKRRPFPATPDDALYYPATGHEAALATLARAVADGDGLALLTGAPGTGKTLLGYCLTERLGAETVCAFLTNSHVADRSALFQAFLYDLGLPYQDGNEQVLRLRLTDYLLTNCGKNLRTVLIVDEAQHLSVDLIEELRLLGNLEASGKKAVQTVLLGQLALLEKLARPELTSMRQRLGVKAEVAALGVEEALDYLLHHLRQAGGHPENIVDEAALEVLARGTAGVPRLLNQAGHQALLAADAADMTIVDAEAALEALSALGLSVDDSSGAAIPVEGSEAASEADLGPRLVGPTRRIA